VPQIGAIPALFIDAQRRGKETGFPVDEKLQRRKFTE
jgi:hypothetical protein